MAKTRQRTFLGSDKRFYLDFEQPLVDVEKKIDKMRRHPQVNRIDFRRELRQLQRQAQNLRLQIYANLTRRQRVQLSCHPQRPYALEYIARMLDDFTELHGDRVGGDDPAVVGGLARLDDRPLMVIGLQSGRTTKERQRRNFGMPHPAGLRKGLRLMRLAAKFGCPILTLVDTAGVHPGIQAEARGQAAAIAHNLSAMAQLPVPIVVALIGKVFNAGTIGFALGDHLLMMEYACTSVADPSIFDRLPFGRRGPKDADDEQWGLTAYELAELGLIDRIVPEPLGGAHRDYDEAAAILKRKIQDALDELENLSVDELLRRRLDLLATRGEGVSLEQPVRVNAV